MSARIFPFNEDPVPGEAVAFDPFIAVPIGGLGLSSISRSISKSFDDIARFFVTPKTVGTVTVGRQGTNIVSKGLASARARMGATTTRIPTVSTGTKALVGTGIVGGTTSLGILSLTPGGQEIVATGRDISKDVTGFGQGVTQFFQSNPLLLAGIVIVAGILVIKK